MRPSLFQFVGASLHFSGVPALEEDASGKAAVEKEHTLYARLADFEQLKNAASKEEHEQWEIKVPKSEHNGAEGVMRIRKTVAEGNPEYVLTTKTKAKEGRHEIGIPTSADHFEQFKRMAAAGLIKHRYCFPIAGTAHKWEVDMFPKEGGGYHPWCKIDLEVDDLSKPLPQLPLQVEQLIDKPYGQRNAQEEQQVRELYDTVFLTPSPFRQQESAQ